MASLTPRDKAELATEIARRVVDSLNSQSGKPALVDAHGLAHAIGVSVSTVDRWTAQGLVPIKIRMGSIRRFDIDEVIAALSQVKEAV